MTDPNMKQKARVFFALWPTVAERAALAVWQPALQHACSGRAMRTEGLHATLVFLGEVESDRLEALHLAAQEVSASAFTLVLNEAHYWGHNHIVFAAPGQVPSALLELVHKLEQSLLHHHFKFDARSYKPHVTLLRKAQRSDTPLPLMAAVAWQVEEFVLVQSHRDEQGASYEVLAHFPLNLAQG